MVFCRFDQRFSDLNDQIRAFVSDLRVAVECGEDVVRKTRQKINDKPPFEIVHSNDARLRDDLAGRTDERQVEVEKNVDEEDDVDETIDHQHRHIVHRLALCHVTTHTQYSPAPRLSSLQFYASIFSDHFIKFSPSKIHKLY